VFRLSKVFNTCYSRATSNHPIAARKEEEKKEGFAGFVADISILSRV